MLPAVVKTLNSSEGIKHFLATIPSTIEAVLDSPPVSELIRHGAKRESIEACLSLQITKTSNMLTVGGNLREGQALEIAIELIHDYPNESLEDFCLMLRRGAKGAYKIDGKSDIFRFDILVINNWMKAYLNDKCQAVEDKLMAEKETYKEQYTWNGVAQTITDEVKRQQIKDRLKAWRGEIEKIDTRPIVPMTDEEIRRRAAPYKDPHSPEWYALRDRIRREASEFYKDKYTLIGMKIFPIKDQEIFAESEEDAVKIYEQATKKE